MNARQGKIMSTRGTIEEGFKHIIRTHAHTNFNGTLPWPKCIVAPAAGGQRPRIWSSKTVQTGSCRWHIPA
jgi:hypothetical protein